ncbi:acyl carrier protein [Desulfofustis limnaeus]|jgi:acyl carrier protein|uniref:Carrier domain-containing protein n=1 Tax=Desulfofustis limnaeus TaxID=2740163 RepID=A0ABN6MA54_9BACT|nr:phosphopantetheine-binding protein [Desulfofustis limnaeus]MDX9896431.1 phosphopantetheine-binding protein [Desulfofustis sp.]BDD88914.1 hypothetical protein DPPLL_32790 [Desulfofustis limnaeus]
MKEDELKQVLFTILKRIAPEAEPERLRPDENIQRALDIDSFDALNFFIHLHQEVGVDVPEADYGKLTTMAEMLRYLSARLE